MSASVARLYQFLQNVIGLGIVAEALQHPQDVAVRVPQLEKPLHFGMLLVVVHAGFCVLPLLCLLRTVWLGNPPCLFIVVHQCLHSNGLCFRTVDRCEKGTEGVSNSVSVNTGSTEAQLWSHRGFPNKLIVGWCSLIESALLTTNS